MAKTDEAKTERAKAVSTTLSGGEYDALLEECFEQRVLKPSKVVRDAIREYLSKRGKLSVDEAVDN